ncbi:LrgB family protein [Segnochrobactraceae bacterium EtOH-i3]
MTDGPDFALWVYLSRTPLFWLTVTLMAYVLADRISLATRRNPFANPVLHAIWMIGGLLLLTGTPYRTYFDGAQFVHFLLGPATVALALPLYENRAVVRRALVPMAVALVVGALTAIISVVVIAKAVGLPSVVVISLAPKSVTAGVAMGISDSLGGDPGLTAVSCILTGIIGAVLASPILNALGLKDRRARGFGMGLACHGIGTARAFQVHPLNGTFAGIAMGLNAFITAALVPLVLAWLMG